MFAHSQTGTYIHADVHKIVADSCSYDDVMLFLSFCDVAWKDKQTDRQTNTQTTPRTLPRRLQSAMGNEMSQCYVNISLHERSICSCVPGGNTGRRRESNAAS